jgi:hypothetical protein
MQSRYKLEDSAGIDAAIKALPLAEERNVLYEGDAGYFPIPTRKAIVVDNHAVSIMSKPYKMVQHKEAFQPIVDGLKAKGVTDYQFTIWANDRRANMAIYVGESTDGVKFGFRATNSFDGTEAINFGFEAIRKIVEHRIVEKEHVLVWTYRQVCSNGATIRVPLKTCKYLSAETVVKIKTLIGEHTKIIHYGQDIEKKLEAIQYVTEAFLLLKDPLDKMITDARDYHVDYENAKKLVKRYIGVRWLMKYIEQYQGEEQSLWGLFNAMTYVASHADIADSRREGIMDKASAMLEAELKV